MYTSYKSCGEIEDVQPHECTGAAALLGNNLTMTKT